MRGTWLVAAGLVFALACGGDQGTGTPDGVAPGEDTQTSPDGTVEDTSAGGDTTQATFCAGDDDCEEGAVCACTGECVVPVGAACTEHRNCGIPFFCNPCTGHCEPQVELCDPCVESFACQDDGACMPLAAGGNHCGRACVTDVGCPLGYACAEVVGATHRQCVPRSGSCQNLGLCTGDGGCPDGTICNTGNGQCFEGCRDDLECADALVCQLGRCVAPCASDLDCEAPAECQADGRCRVPGACESKVDCPDPATYCDREEGMCKAGCLADNDCGDAAMRCDDRACVPRGCQHNFECQFDWICDKPSNTCVVSPDPHCGACGDSGDTPCDDPRLCVSFQNEDGDPLGDHCLLPCEDDPVDRCPSGYACQSVEIDGAPRFLCFRPCYFEPVTPPAP